MNISKRNFGLSVGALGLNLITGCASSDNFKPKLKEPKLDFSEFVNVDNVDIKDCLDIFVMLLADYLDFKSYSDRELVALKAAMVSNFISVYEVNAKNKRLGLSVYDGATELAKFFDERFEKKIRKWKNIGFIKTRQEFTIEKSPELVRDYVNGKISGRGRLDVLDRGAFHYKLANYFGIRTTEADPFNTKFIVPFSEGSQHYFVNPQIAFDYAFDYNYDDFKSIVATNRRISLVLGGSVKLAPVLREKDDFYGWPSLYFKLISNDLKLIGIKGLG